VVVGLEREWVPKILQVATKMSGEPLVVPTIDESRASRFRVEVERNKNGEVSQWVEDNESWKYMGYLPGKNCYVGYKSNIGLRFAVRD